MNQGEVNAIIADYERDHGFYYPHDGQLRRAINLGPEKSVEGYPCMRYLVHGKNRHLLIGVGEFTRLPREIRWVLTDYGHTLNLLKAA